MILTFKKISTYILLSLAVLSCNHTQRNFEPENETEEIRINQLGYLPHRVKKFVVVNTEASEFEVVDRNGKTVHSGNLIDQGEWTSSGEQVRIGDFTSFDEEGSNYRILVEGTGLSYPFDISYDVFTEAGKASIKSYYFQRNSMPIEERYGGKFARPAGHPDDTVYYHPSSGRSSGFKSSKYGWYDAGDYGKYVVNAGVSAGTMLALYERFPDVFADGSLNIPESGNGQNDLLDEIRYELDWLITMQDNDGGVFTKVTTKNFVGFVMPHETHEDRYFIGKSTAASLNYAALLAMASRIYQEIDSEFAEDILNMAEKAWNWAVTHPEKYYRNPEDIFTGGYGDRNVTQEWFWAAAELYITTGEEQYLEPISNKLDKIQFNVGGSWANFQDKIGYFSLLGKNSPLDDTGKSTIKTSLINLTDSLGTVLESAPYHIPIDRFVWGSNSDILNTAVLFANAFLETGNPKYLNWSIETTDYVLGKNATGYSFLTGFGDKKVMHIHHRPSGADGIDEPVPGFVAGGPNAGMNDRNDLGEGISYPDQTHPAKVYIDAQGSYASNEVCLNWNAPMVYMFGFLEGVKY